MKKRIVSLVVAFAAIAAALVNAYLLFFKGESQSETQTQSQSSQETTSSAQAATTVAQDQAAEVGTYTDGTYTGAVVSTNRGDYQVQVTIAGGQMTDIQVVLFPEDNDMSKEINGTNLPIYTAEALENQSAEVNQISGASEAFKGFTGSLQDALNQAS